MYFLWTKNSSSNEINMHIIWRSLQLDWEFLLLDTSVEEKMEFLWKKYFTLIKLFFFKPIPGKSSVVLFGRDYYYDDRYGIAVLQSTYTDNALLKAFIRPGSVIVDIGANIGQFRFFSEQFLKAKKVYSFEPILQTYNVLKKNFPKNSYNFAVSKKKTLEFYLFPLSVWASSIFQENTMKKEIVKGIRLKNIEQIRKEKKIDLIKIDVEGAEEEVLTACETILTKSHYLLIEASIDRNATGTIFSLMNTVKKMLPDAQLIRIGRSYTNDEKNTTGAVDILFENVL